MTKKVFFKPLEGPLPEEAYVAVAQENSLELRHPATERIARLLFTLENYQFDELTGLLNRDPFMNLLEHRINDLRTGNAGASHAHRNSVLLMLDVIDMHGINNTKGHHEGNKKLKSVGHSIDNLIRSEDDLEATGGRLGGDEFAVLVSYDADQYTQETATQAILARLSARIDVDEDFPALRIGNAAEILPTSEVIELFKEADPKRPQTTGQKLGRVALSLYQSSKRWLKAV